jgi:hypothetical protein
MPFKKDPDLIQETLPAPENPRQVRSLKELLDRASDAAWLLPPYRRISGWPRSSVPFLAIAGQKEMKLALILA